MLIIACPLLFVKYLLLECTDKLLRHGKLFYNFAVHGRIIFFKQLRLQNTVLIRPECVYPPLLYRHNNSAAGPVLQISQTSDKIFVNQRPCLVRLGGIHLEHAVKAVVADF